MNERDGCKILKESIEYAGGWFYKIPDMPKKSQCKKPFDGVFIYEGNIYFFEMKYLDKYKTFDVAKVKEHQPK